MPNKYFYSYTAKTGELTMSVADGSGNVVWSMKYPSHVEDKVTGDLIEEPTLIDMHLMGSVADVEGLGKLLKGAGIIPEDSELVKKKFEDGGLLEYEPNPYLTPKQSEIEALFANELNSNYEKYKNEYLKNDNRVVGADEIKEMSDDYRSDRTTNAEAVRRPASAFAKKIYSYLLDKELESGYVLFTSGGTGAGKTTAIHSDNSVKTLHDKADVVYDSNMNGLEAAELRIQQAFETGRDIVVVYIYRDIINSFINGVIPRAQKHNNNGRTVSIPEHINTHLGSLEVLGELMDKYHDDNRIQFYIFDNSVENGIPALATLAKIKKKNYLSIHELKRKLYAINEDQRRAENITEKQYRAFAVGAGTDEERNRKIEQGGKATIHNIPDSTQSWRPELQRQEQLKYNLLADFTDDDIFFLEGLSRDEALVKFKELTHRPDLLYAEVYYNDTNGNGYVSGSHTIKLFQKNQFADGGIVSPLQFGDAVDFVEDGPENINGNPKYRKGLTGHVVNIKKDGDDFLYSVRRGMTTTEDVPASHIRLHNADTAQKVEEILNEKQKSKTFKDVGKRVIGSAKERRAYSMITFADLKNIEADEITAMELVTKQRVYPEVNVAEQRAAGVSSGAAYMKVKLREACGNKPPNSKEKRASYILFIENLTKGLAPLKTVAEVKDYMYAFREMPADEIIGYFIDPNFFTMSDEMKEKTREDIKKIRGLSFVYSSGALVSKFLTELFSKRFSNFLFRQSDAAALIFFEARNLEGISDEQSAALIEKYKYQKTKFIEANEEKLKAYQEADEKTLLTKLIFDWRSPDLYKKDPERLRTLGINYFQKNVDNGKKALENIPENLLAHPDNWEWFDGKKEKKTVVRSGEITINSGTPLSYIKRTNGIVVPEKYVDAAANTNPEDNPIIRDFGFASVQFGNALTDTRAKEHIRHFLGSIIDMSEALNIAIKYFNKIGGLSMAFASRGKGKAAAHYESGRAIINLTNNNGDGTVAHEFGHYFDNALTIHGKNAVSLKFGSDDFGAIDNYAIRNKMEALVEFIKNGKEGITPQVYVTFKAAKELAEKPPRYYNEQKRAFEEVELAEDIDTTIKNLAEKTRTVRGLAADDFERRETILSYVIKAFGMDEYDVLFNTKQSAFAFYSSKMRSKYWTSTVEMFARGWETFIFDKLQRSGHNNNYLVSGEYFDQKMPVMFGGFTYLYPFGEERKYLFTLYDDLVQTVKKELSLPDFTPPGDKREDEYIVFDKKGEREVVEENGEVEVEVEKMQDGGIAHNENDIILYHGSKSEFDDFDESVEGSGEGSDLFGKGFYLTDDEVIANFYGHAVAKKDFIDDYEPTGIFGTYEPVFKDDADEQAAKNKRVLAFKFTGNALDEENYIIGEEFRKAIVDIADKYSPFKGASAERAFTYLRGNKDKIRNYRGELIYIIEHVGMGDKKIVQAISDYVREMGYDAIKYPSDIDFEGGGFYNYVVFNKSALKKIKEFSDGGDVTEIQDLIIDQSLTPTEKQDLVFAKGGIFYSPNENENLSFGEAEKNLSTKEHEYFKLITDKIDEELGIKTTNLSAIGDWVDGAENTIFAEVDDVPDLETLKYSAALKGLIGNQKAVLVFIEDQKGNDGKFILDFLISPDDTVRALNKVGLHFRTIIKGENNTTRVIIFDKNLENSTIISKLAYNYGIHFKYQIGKGELFGSETSRKESERIFIDFIQKKEAEEISEERLSGRYNRERYKQILADIHSGRQPSLNFYTGGKILDQENKNGVQYYGFRGNSETSSGEVQKTHGKRKGGILRTPRSAGSQRSGKSSQKQVAPGDKKSHSQKSSGKHSNSKLPK